MAGMGAGYDLSVSTFSPDGKVFQVEYAQSAVDNGGVCLGCVCTDGIVLGTEKVILNKMTVKGSGRRVYAVDTHVSMVCAGFIADGRILVERAREEAKSYKYHFGSPIPGRVLAERIAMFVHEFTLYWSVRPFGVSVLIATVEGGDPSTASIYCVEPAGTCYKYRGYALGKGRQLAKTELEKLKPSEMTCKDAVNHLARIITQVRDENKDKDVEIEMCWNSPESNHQHAPVPRQVIQEAEEKAQQHLEALEQD
eukprot:GHVN01076018.1.p1 GENE.GHVN01076018.1~~GHVN01076018.1.p1  ORF type:complete len:253 (+),score=58.02 GHVN01076018.1:118-876(+)